MPRTEGKDGFEVLAELRRLERRLRELKAGWRSFREDPTRKTLVDVRVAADRLSRTLESLSRRLGTDGQPEPECSPAAPSPRGVARPFVRDVIAASRELDTLIWQLTGLWKDLSNRPSQRLESLVRLLGRATERAGALIGALGGTIPEEPGGAIGHSPEKPGSASGRVEGLARELEARLWRVQTDWHGLRQAPSVDRVSVLHAELAEAALCAIRLEQDVARSGDEALRRALRIGRLAQEGVRLQPYRDPFTGAYNREGFDTLAGAELKRCRRYGRRFGILVLQIAPADLEGLRSVVASARAELRDYDLLARYLEDLLVVGIPEGGRGPSRRVASRILKALRRSGDARAFRALAYATSPEDGATLSGLIEAARRRLRTPGGAQP